jgi:hypothetical protein
MQAKIITHYFARLNELVTSKAIQNLALGQGANFDQVSIPSRADNKVLYSPFFCLKIK